MIPLQAAYIAPARPAVHAPLVYISDAYNNFVAVFDRNGTSVGTITTGIKGPQGLFVDARHNLWVANAGGANILKFPRGSSSPAEVLDDAGAQPYDVTMCPDGTVFVANVGPFFSGGNVEVYPRGRHKPTRSLSYASLPTFYLTCDASGNVFAAVVASTSVVVEFPHGQQTGAQLLGIGSGGNPGGLKVESNGDLLYNTEEGAVVEYTNAGVPTGRSVGVPGGWTDIALDRQENALLGADRSSGEAVSFPNGTLLQTYSDSNFSFATGVAFDPALRP
jgi:hypothetical protein